MRIFVEAGPQTNRIGKCYAGNRFWGRMRVLEKM
jgi:hypothetical protein